MPVRLFVNELSFPDADCSVNVAADRLEKFVGIFRAISAIDRNARIDTAVPLAQLLFANNWPLAALRNHPNCKESGLYLQRLADRAPFVHALEEVPGDDAGGPDYRMAAASPVSGGKRAIALGLAHSFGGMSVSLSTHEAWSTAFVDIERLQLDAAGELQTSIVSARNAMSDDVVAEHSAFFNDLVRPVATTGAEIWDRRGDLFARLRFIPRTEGQLRALLHGDPLVGVVLDKLLKIDEAIRIWRTTGCAYPPIPFYVRPESRKKLAEFPDDDGTIKLFSWHCDYAPGENRLHYLLEEEPSKFAVIGHVGRKLGIG